MATELMLLLEAPCVYPKYLCDYPHLRRALMRFSDKLVARGFSVESETKHSASAVTICACFTSLIDVQERSGLPVVFSSRLSFVMHIVGDGAKWSAVIPPRSPESDVLNVPQRPHNTCDLMRQPWRD